MSRHYKTRLTITIIIMLLAGVSVLYYFNPETSVFIPKCPFKLITGWSCPGCGFQRAIHAFLHGDLTAALHYNWFLILSVPYFLGLLMGECAKKGIWHEKVYPILKHHYTIYFYIILFFSWWILRNFLGI